MHLKNVIQHSKYIITLAKSKCTQKNLTIVLNVQQIVEVVQSYSYKSLRYIIPLALCVPPISIWPVIVLYRKLTISETARRRTSVSDWA